MTLFNRKPTLDLGAAVRRLREQRGISLDELALRTGLDKGNLSRIERGQQALPTARLEQIAAALDLAPIDIYVNADTAGNVGPGPGVGKTVPLFTWSQVRDWRKMIEQVDEHTPKVATTWPARENTFALTVYGDSMEPRFPDGAIIIVDPDITAKVGDFVVVRQGGNDATLKQLATDGGTQYLRPLNPRYPVLPLAADAEIVGVVKRVEMDV